MVHLGEEFAVMEFREPEGIVMGLCPPKVWNDISRAEHDWHYHFGVLCNALGMSSEEYLAALPTGEALRRMEKLLAKMEADKRMGLI